MNLSSYIWLTAALAVALSAPNRAQAGPGHSDDAGGVNSEVAWKVVHETNPYGDWGPIDGGRQGRAGTGGHGRGNGITYHGGPVMLGTVNIYYIWYGNWSGNTATTILTDLANNIGGSQYYNINTTYYYGNGVHISNSIHYAGSTTDNYSQGTALSDAGVQAVVSSAISSGALPKDANGVYFVFGVGPT
jgi:hypothetical protein